MIIYNIIPAAGKSKRMNRNKYLLKINNKSMITTVIDNLLYAKLSNIYLVTSDNSPVFNEVKNYNNITILINNLESSEMADSIRVALKHINASNSDGILITPADIPLVKVDTINELIRNFKKNKDKIIIPIYKDRKGHPVIFPSKIIYDLFNENTLRDVIKKHENDILYCNVHDEGILLDIDTEEDYKKIMHPNESI
jgi:molybdenum cofactor cytidylyltransferase